MNPLCAKPLSWIFWKKDLFSGIKIFARYMILIALLPTVFCHSSALANPTGGQVTAGNATISSPSPTTVQINQYSDKAIVEWHSFNIAPNEKTHFQQPTSSSIILNRINPSQGVSQIFGQLSANGRIILVNQAGIYFGTTARVDVGGIIASTSNISNANFMAGKYVFDGPSGYGGSVINKGTIRAGNAGLVALVGTSLQNDGLIVAKVGSVVLASGSKFTLDFIGDGLINFAIDEPAASLGVDQNKKPLKHSVSNSGKIIANGGQIIMKASAVRGVLRSSINMSGVLIANSVNQKNGVIILSAGNGTTHVTGKIYAAGKHQQQTGGKVYVLGNKVKLKKNAIIDVSGKDGGGEILIGGDYQGKNPSILNAQNTFVGKNVVIKADALKTGNGGKVIVWANDATRFFGSISAKGGIINGNGGFIETSGKNYLDVKNSKVTASASQGMAGTWLLDPRNVIIDAAATTCTSTPCFSVGDPTIYTPDTNTSHVSITDILNALEGGTSVTITTGTTGAQTGTIAVNAAIDKTLGTTPVTLTLDSTNGGGTITVSNPITSTSGMLGVSLLSGNAITITSNITTNGGDFLGQAQNTITLGNGSGTTPGSIDVGAGSIAVNANQDGAGGQNFTMNPSSTLLSTNNTTDAIQIIVNTPSNGTGQASLRDITTGNAGKIIVSTDGTLGLGTGNTTGSTITVNAGNTISGGDILMTTPNAITFNGAVNTTGTINIFANTNASTSRFTMASGSSITTTNATANAVSINVNTALGGTGTAVLRDITTGDGGTITVNTDTGGNVTGGDITQPTGTLTAGNSGTITLTNPNVAGRNIGTSGANIQIAAGTLNLTTGTGGGFITNLSTDAFNLGNINTAGAFSLTSTSSSSINDTGTLTIGGTTTLTAGSTQDITLNSIGNDFSTITINSGNNIAVTDINSLNFGASTITGDLDVISGGAITDSAAISVGGITTLSAGSNNITLDSSTNDFNVVSITDGNDVILRDANNLIFGNISITGNLTLTNSGAVTQDVSSALLVNGANKIATFAAGVANDITLNNTGNDFTSVVISSGNNINLRDVNNLQFGSATSTINGTLDLTTNGNITQLGGALFVNGLATLNSGVNNDITLNNATNNFGTVKILNANNATLRDTSTLDIDASSVTTALTLTADNGITQSGSITAPTLIATTRNNGAANIILNNINNHVNTINLHTLNSAGTSNSAGVITFSDADTFDISAIGTTSAINLTSADAISDSGNITGGTLTTNSGSGTILDFGHNISGFNASNTASGNIQLINTGTLSITGINQSSNGTIDISNTGSITTTGDI
ncbi:MAG: filamentous hemagglutinin N-terminal domain-containing protein [Gammaproteobacteria bacterium]